MSTPRFVRTVLSTSLCVSLFALSACQPQQPAQNQSGTPATAASGAAPATSSAPTGSAGSAQASAYTPPSADQLYQMVAPIALFPDKLVAQVLAGSTYPEQISAADTFLGQNHSLSPTLLQSAVQPEPWDASVKGLIAFPSVLDQMAQNIQWTTSLGETYVNDPTDVMNAIQVMRQRAQAHGNLRSSAQQQITSQVVESGGDAANGDGGYANADGDNGAYPPSYNGTPIVPAPQQLIEIAPAQPDVVYVPSYDPQTVYGGDVPVYPDYNYAPPRYSTGEVVAVGAITFGAAIAIGSLMEHHRDNGGWNAWGMNWGHGNRGGYAGGQRPAVVYNNQTYVSRSTTVVNRYNTTNAVNNRTSIVNNNRTVNNNVVNNRTVNNETTATRNQFEQNRNPVANHPAAGPMSMPNFQKAGYPTAPTHGMQQPNPAIAPQRNAAQESALRAQQHRGAAPGQPAQSFHPTTAVPPSSVPHTMHIPPGQAHPLPSSHMVPPVRPLQESHPQPAHPQPPLARPVAPHPMPHPVASAQARPASPPPQQHAAPRPVEHAPPPGKKDDHHN